VDVDREADLPRKLGQDAMPFRRGAVPKCTLAPALKDPVGVIRDTIFVIFVIFVAS